MKKRFWAVIAALVSAGLFLRFALRGYAWWGYLLFFIAALLVMHRYLPATLWRVVVVLVCIGLVYFCFVEYFIIKNARTDKDAGRDYLIVLGAAVYKDQPSLTLVRRLEGALQYLNEHPKTIAIVSGGKGSGEEITEAQAMHDWLIAHGIPEARIIMEPKATSTLENLQYAIPYDSNGHVRAMKTFVKASTGSIQEILAVAGTVAQRLVVITTGSYLPEINTSSDVDKIRGYEERVTYNSTNGAVYRIIPLVGSGHDTGLEIYKNHVKLGKFTCDGEGRIGTNRKTAEPGATYHGWDL